MFSTFLIERPLLVAKKAPAKEGMVNRYHLPRHIGRAVMLRCKSKIRSLQVMFHSGMCALARGW